MLQQIDLSHLTSLPLANNNESRMFIHEEMNFIVLVYL